MKSKKELKFFQTISKIYDEMIISGQSGNFQFQEGPSTKDVQANGKIYHEVFLLMKILHTRRRVKNMKIN